MRIVSTVVVMTAVPMALCGAAAETFVLHDESIHTVTTRFALEAAAKTALAKLEQPSCLRMLSDFHDASGRPLQAELDRLGDTPRSFLARLTFHEELGRRCRDPRVLAFTSIGARDVFICGGQFWQTYRRDPDYVEALLIHELLHTLGLGENPPSSLEITTHVRKTCRSR